MSHLDEIERPVQTIPSDFVSNVYSFGTYGSMKTPERSKKVGIMKPYPIKCITETYCVPQSEESMLEEEHQSSVDT